MSITMHKYLHRFLVTGMTAILTLSICAGVAAESYTANIMRLLNYEGDVFIVDENGEYSFLMENMRFNNGESLSTSKGSMASVGLDSSKILTLDAMTQVLFETVKNQMKLTLASGRLLLDVQEKLDENQSLDIETSTMVVGIRGTVVHVTSFDGTEEEMNRRLMEANPTFQELLLKMLPDSIDGNISQLVVLEGTASATYRDENGVSRTIEVNAGEKITLVDRNQDDRVDETFSCQRRERFCGSIGGKTDPYQRGRRSSRLGKEWQDHSGTVHGSGDPAGPECLLEGSLPSESTTAGSSADWRHHSSRS